jgi:hypothetical protein
MNNVEQKEMAKIDDMATDFGVVTPQTLCLNVRFENILKIIDLYAV